MIIFIHDIRDSSSHQLFALAVLSRDLNGLPHKRNRYPYLLRGTVARWLNESPNRRGWLHINMSQTLPDTPEVYGPML